MLSRHRARGFTLIELLVVIAIIAILAVVVVLTLNPSNLLAQSRDANRVNDMATLNNAVNLYVTDQANNTPALGTGTTTYLDLPDSSSVCANQGLPASGYAYHCSTAANYRNASTTGWIPINFQNISAGSPLSVLPVDPVNQTSSNLYYDYYTANSQYILSSFMESQKYAKTMQTTGGNDPAVYQIGSGLGTMPDASRGLVGYWPLNEGGSVATATDWSVGGNSAAWNGSMTGGSYYASTGRSMALAGNFNGTNDYLAPAINTSSFSNGAFTWSVWVNFTTMTTTHNMIINFNRPYLDVLSSKMLQDIRVGGTDYQVSGRTTLTTGTWYMMTGTYDGTTQNIYLNGSLENTAAGGPGAQSFIGGFCIGTYVCPSFTYPSNALIQDVRLYNRVLSAAEIQEMYNAEK